MRASGNIAGAIGVLRTMSAKHPDNTRVLALLGDSLMESGDATEAHAMYRKLYCDYAADFNVSRQIQRMLEVAGGRLSMHGWPVHAFPSHRQPPARPSSPRENRSYRNRPPPHVFCSVTHTRPHQFPPSLTLVTGGGALINLGIAYKNLRRFDDALRTYAKVFRGAGSAGCWRGWGEASLLLHKHTWAMRCCNAAAAAGAGV